MKRQILSTQNDAVRLHEKTVHLRGQAFSTKTGLAKQHDSLSFKKPINGAHNCRRVEIDPSLLEDDQEMLEDLIAAAFNDAARPIDETQKENMASVSKGMQLTPGFKMPL